MTMELWLRSFKERTMIETIIIVFACTVINKTFIIIIHGHAVILFCAPAPALPSVILFCAATAMRWVIFLRPRARARLL